MTTKVKKIIRLSCLICLWILCLFPPLEGAETEEEEADFGSELKSVTWKALPGGTEEVQLIFNRHREPKISAIEGERPRVVCDFKGAEKAKEVTISTKTGGEWVKGIRLWVHESPYPYLRVVLDLLQGINYFVEPFFAEDGKVYILRISKDSSDASKKAEKEGPGANSDADPDSSDFPAYRELKQDGE